jgi:hypothetical protein
MEASKLEAAKLEAAKLWSGLFVACLDEVAESRLEPGESPVELALSAANEAFELCRDGLEPEQSLAELADAAAQATDDLLGPGAAQAAADAAQQDAFYRFLKGGGP